MTSPDPTDQGIQKIDGWVDGFGMFHKKISATFPDPAVLGVTHCDTHTDPLTWGGY